MLSHVKYRYSIFKRIEKNLNIIQAPNVKNNIALFIVRENIQCPFPLCFGVYTPTQYALSCKIQKFYI